MIEHDLTVYGNDPYEKENLISMTNYVKLIDRYSDSKDSFLELGIGHSKTIELLSEKFSNVVVIDAEAMFIEKYSCIYPDMEFVHSYFEDTNFTAKSFDNIGMGFILEHVQDPALILRKYSSLLAKNGKIFVSVPNAKSLHRIIAQNAGLLSDITMMSEVDKLYGHLRFLGYEEWIELFEQMKLEIVASHGLYLKPFTATQIESLDLEKKIYDALALTARDYPQISNSCFFVLKNKID